MMNKYSSVLFLILIFSLLSAFSCNGNDSKKDAENITESDIESPDPDISEPVNCVYEEIYEKNIIISPSSNIWYYFLHASAPSKLRFLVKEYGETVSEGDQWDPKGTRRIGLTCSLIDEDKELLDNPLKSENIAITFQNYFEKDFIEKFKGLKMPLSIFLEDRAFASTEGDPINKMVYTIRDSAGELVFSVVSMITEEKNEALEIWPAKSLPELDAKQVMPEEGCIENTNLVELNGDWVTDSNVNPFLEVKHVPSGQTAVVKKHEYKDLENFKVYVFSSNKAGPNDYDGFLSSTKREWAFTFFTVSKKILE